MGALQKIREAGFNIALKGDALAISPASALTQNQREFLKQHKTEILGELRAEVPGLSETDREKLLAYMVAIEERDPEMIAEFLDVCSQNPDKLAWALYWADKVLGAGEPMVLPDDRHYCNECRHLYKGYCLRQQFKPLDDIPRRCGDFLVKNL